MVNARPGLRGGKSAAGFLVGGGGMDGALVGVSSCAAFANTNSYLDLAGKSYDYGRRG